MRGADASGPFTCARIGVGRVNIGIVGGIFGSPAEYRRRVLWTPETILVDGLRQRGHTVRALSHADSFDLGDFDIVHVHHLSWGAMRASTGRSSTPFVFTVHGAASGHPHAQRFVMARADGIVTIWPQESELLSHTHRVAGAEIRLIPNGVNADAFPFHPPEHRRERAWRLLFVGQLIRLKGIDLLLDAVAELRHRREIELDLTYQDPTEESRWRRRSRELGLEDVVRFVGPTPQATLSARYLAADIVVLPSRSEALPSVLTEAMLSGCYAVATDVGGVRDQLGEFGVVVDDATPQAIADGVERAMDTFEEHRRRAEAMRRYAQDRFSTHAMVTEHEELYTSLVERGSRPRRAGGTRLLATTLARWSLALSGRS